MQNKDKSINAIISHLKELISFSEEYNEIWFESNKDIVKKLLFKWRLNLHFLKRVLFIERSDEITYLVEESFRVNYFLHIVDDSLYSPKLRFEQF